MTDKKTLTVVDNETGEIVTVGGETLISETDDYVIFQDSEGKFKRRAKYKNYSSFKAETRKDKIWLLNLIDGGEDTGIGLSDHVGKEIEVEHIITREYDAVNEDTGAMEYGVLTYLITPDRTAYVTSSKSVHFSIERITSMLGYPHEEGWENIIVKVYSEKGTNGNIIKIKLVG